ncbi:N-acetylneuraminate synthase family protein [Algoriphagus aquimarinus]|uniref:N-acetylneuraminate synthase family protein n=1 Tax=Algoriphagus aquimarinus TaxID=237018 RepID=UPI0030DD3DEF|tara:strand:+ start:99864 stop:100907 length:1044 start_codon:yes stop_codon:yes gene_type:complete
MNKPYIEIAGRKIGYDFPPLVIAEIGINHGGSLEVAKEMVDSAKRAGVEMVKHQTHIVDDEMSREAKNTIPSHTKESIYEIMQTCALSEQEELEFKEYVEAQGMIFVSTPFSRAAADRLISWDVEGFKIGSGECNNHPLLEHIASFGKPMILSTGMNDLASVAKSVAILEKHKAPFALLHTTNLYPTPNHLVRLGAMAQLQEAFPQAVIGLSDHTITNHACFGAVALGASILERHYTDHMQRQGPDIVCSMDEQACAELIEGSKIIQLQRGGDKKAVAEEQATIDFAFATVCTIQPIQAGEQFTKENIWVKRPGKGGILAEHFESILGKTATEDLEVDIQVQWKSIK